MLHCMSPLLAQSAHPERSAICPLSGQSGQHLPQSEPLHSRHECRPRRTSSANSTATTWRRPSSSRNTSTSCRPTDAPRAPGALDRLTMTQVGGCLPQPLVHLPKIRPVNRCLRCRDRVALRFWGSRPGCDCEDRPNRNKDPEDKSEGFPSHVSLLMQEVRVAMN